MGRLGLGRGRVEGGADNSREACEAWLVWIAHGPNKAQTNYLPKELLPPTFCGDVNHENTVEYDCLLKLLR